MNRAAPITGQPGLYRLAGTSNLNGLGISVDSLNAKVTAVQAQYDALKTSMTPLLNAYGPLDQDSLQRVLAAVQQAGSSPAIIGAASFVGVLRLALASSVGNIARARAILAGSPTGHEDIVANLLTTAQNVLDATDTLVSSAVAAQGAVASGARRLGLSGGLGVFGIDDATAVLGILAAVGLVVGAVLIYAVFVQVQAASNARDVADSACARDAAAGHPCTGTQWAQYRTDADAQARRQSVVPDFSDILQSVGSLIFWGGLLAVGAAVGYAVWTTLPAATVARSSLTRRASSLGRLDGTPAEHFAKAEQLLGKARRERERGRFTDALVTASAANAEAQWTGDYRLKGETYHEVGMAKAGIRMGLGGTAKKRR